MEKLIEYIKLLHKEYVEAAAIFKQGDQDSIDRAKLLEAFVKDGKQINDEFKQIATQYFSIDYVIPQEVDMRASRFVQAVDAFKSMEEGELPSDVIADYMKLKQSEIKPKLIIKDGKFVPVDEGVKKYTEQNFMEAYDTIAKFLE